jgi:hypothetical protein
MLDITCFLDQDLNRLAKSRKRPGSSSMLPSVDLTNHWQITFNMFKNQNELRTRFVPIDLFNVDTAELGNLQDNVDIVSLTNVLHQWNLDGQIKACKRLVKLTRLGSMIVGVQIETNKATSHGATAGVCFNGETQFAHDSSTFKQMWTRISEETNTVWQCDASLLTFEDDGHELSGKALFGPDAGTLRWTVRRVR